MTMLPSTGSTLITVVWVNSSRSRLRTAASFNPDGIATALSMLYPGARGPTGRGDGEAVALTLTEFWVVHALARHPGHVRTREQLMSAANVVLDDSTVTSQIKRIRAKFVACDSKFSAIDTVYGMGYRWSGEQSGE